MTHPAEKDTPDQREPRPCPRCGVTCTYDGWGHVHPNGVGIGSCPISPVKHLPDVDARLTWMLRVLGDQFGPLGVLMTVVDLWPDTAEHLFPTGPREDAEIVTLGDAE